MSEVALRETSVEAAAQELLSLQERRAWAYAKMHDCFRPQFTMTDEEARAMQQTIQGDVVEVQKEMMAVSASVRAVEERLLALSPCPAPAAALARRIRSLQTLEKQKLEVTQRLYRTRGVLKMLQNYASGELEEWELKEEYTASDMEGEAAPIDVKEAELEGLRRQDAALIEEINDLLEEIEAVAGVGREEE